MSLRQPVVIDVPFREGDREVERRIDLAQREVDGHALTSEARLLLKTYPTVYIIRGKKHQRVRGGYEYDEFLLYVG